MSEALRSRNPSSLGLEGEDQEGKGTRFSPWGSEHQTLQWLPRKEIPVLYCLWPSHLMMILFWSVTPLELQGGHIFAASSNPC